MLPTTGARRDRLATLAAVSGEPAPPPVVAVLGAGSWGTTVAAIAARRVPTTLWARRADVADRIERERVNAQYLPGVPLPDMLHATTSMGEACRGASTVVLAVPSQWLRRVLEQAAPEVHEDATVLSLAKGIERETLARMSQVAGAVLGRPERVAVLTGPNIATEIAMAQPAAAVVACGDDQRARRVQSLFMAPALRVYTNPDVVGCEIAGAAKNVIAIVAGIAAGLGYGANTAATVMTRGLAEVTRLGVALGGDPLTFAGLAGMGDLIATCTSPQSRNRQVGVALGEGEQIEHIVARATQVAEGVSSTAALLALAARAGVEMPLASFAGSVLYDRARPADLIPELMAREAKPELEGIRP